MNKLIIAILLFTLIATQNTNPQTDGTACKVMILKQLANGRLFSDTLNLSGKYLNELGNFNECVRSEAKKKANITMKYELKTYRSNKQDDQFDMKFVIGLCTFQVCDDDSLTAFDTFYIQSAFASLKSDFNTEKPENVVVRINTILEERQPGFYVMISIIFAALFLSFVGIIVQYSKLGNLTEKKIQFQVQFQSDDTVEGKQQYIDLLIQTDRLLLNRKKIWAIFFLCFSIPRNFMILFYDTEKSRKVSFIRHLKVFGFFWVSMSSTLQVALMTYPLNYSDIPKLTSGFIGTLMTSGIIYGYGIIYFYMGFQVMNDRLMCMYIKKQQFNMLLFIVKNYLYYMIPVCYITVMILFVMPFIGDGPMYPKIMDDFFLNSCGNYWWTNVLLVSNYVPWNVSDMCASHISLISNEFQLIIILIPLLGFVYKNYFRRALMVVFGIIGIVGSFLPVLIITIDNKVDGYPGYLSNSFNDMLTKIYFRIPPFLIGIALAIFQFEYKYVDKLNDGSKPFHKDYLEKITKKSLTFKTVFYSVGFACVLAPLLVLVQQLSQIDTHYQCPQTINYRQQMYYYRPFDLEKLNIYLVKLNMSENIIQYVFQYQCITRLAQIVATCRKKYI